jgi:hypothetical protein
VEEEELEGLEVADSFDAHGLDDIFATRFSSPIQLSRSFQLICYNVNCSVLYYYVELKNNESKRTYDKMISIPGFDFHSYFFSAQSEIAYDSLYLSLII